MSEGLPLKLRCYCCGKPISIEGTIALVSMSKTADRVMVMLPGHVARAEAVNHLLVKERNAL